MAKQTLEELTRDPMVLALAQADDKQLVNELLASGFLSVSLTTLRGWRTAGRKPPAAIKLDTKVKSSVRYPVGELRKFVEQALAGDTPEPELAPIALPRAQPEGGLSSHLGMNLKPVKRGRRKGVKHSSYPEFMAKGAPDDEWVFALIPDPNKGAYRRPVDLIETLHMPEEQIGDATCEQLSMTDYLDRLSGYLQAKAGQDLAGERAGEMATVPPSRVKRPGSDKRS